MNEEFLFHKQPEKSPWQEKAFMPIGILFLVFLISAIGYRVATRVTFTPGAAESVLQLDEQLVQVTNQFDVVLYGLRSGSGSDDNTFLGDLVSLEVQADGLDAAVFRVERRHGGIRRKKARKAVDAGVGHAEDTAKALRTAVEEVESYLASYEHEDSPSDPTKAINALKRVIESIEASRSALVPAIEQI